MGLTLCLQNNLAQIKKKYYFECADNLLGVDCKFYSMQ